MSIFWDLAKTIMYKRNYSQKELASAIKKPLSTINRWYNQDIVPPADYALKIAKALATSLDYLITGEDFREDPVYTQMKNNKKVKQITEIALKLKDDQNDILLTTAKAFYAQNDSYEEKKGLA